MSAVSRRSLLAGSGALVLGGLLASCAPSRTPAPVRPTPRIVPADTVFTSGASCIGITDGQFAGWRGKPLAVTSTWAANGGLEQIEGEWSDWTASIDYAAQFGYEDAFSWTDMAAGRWDDRITRSVTALRDAWGDRTGTLYYRFQHEFNGDWYPWAATDGTASRFVEGWRRFADLFREATEGDDRFKIVWSPNGGTQSQAVRDIRSLWPGAASVDVIGVDYYDFFSIASTDDWRRQVDSLDAGGGPVGLGAWQRFAADQGVALSLPEWGNQYGDNPLFIEVMHDLILQNTAGGPDDTAGRIVYEVYFNQRFDDGTPATEGDFRVMADQQDSPLRPNAAAKYRTLWSAWDHI